VKAVYDGKEIEFEVPKGLDPEAFKTGLLTTQRYHEQAQALEAQRAQVYAQADTFQKSLDFIASKVFVDFEKLEASGLKESDPEAYFRQKMELEDSVEKLKAVNKHARAAQQREDAELARQAMSRLGEVIPEWLDDSTKNREANEMTTHYVSQGFTNEDLSQIYDPKVLSIMRKAYLYDKAKTSRVGKVVAQATKKHTQSEPSRGRKGGKKKALSDEELFFGSGL
jgi:hypothetical protein